MGKCYVLKWALMREKVAKYMKVHVLVCLVYVTGDCTYEKPASAAQFLVRAPGLKRRHGTFYTVYN